MVDHCGHLGYEHSSQRAMREVGRLESCELITRNWGKKALKMHTWISYCPNKISSSCSGVVYGKEE
jgi:hypothetical protein